MRVLTNFILEPVERELKKKKKARFPCEALARNENFHLSHGIINSGQKGMANEVRGLQIQLWVRPCPVRLAEPR